jgi:hypothetical protein
MEVCDGKASAIHGGVQARSDPIDEDDGKACLDACEIGVRFTYIRLNYCVMVDVRGN